MQPIKHLVRLLLAILAVHLGAPAAAAPTHISASLVPETTSAAPGETVMLAFYMNPDPGWHGYWENPGDAGLGITPKWSLPPGASAGDLRYPVPQTLLTAGLMNHVYKGDYAVLVPVTLPANARPGATLPIVAETEWLACTDTICVPERGRLETRLTIGEPGTADPRFDEWRRRLPAPLAEAARYELGPGGLRLAIPLPASASLGEPHVFVGTQGLIDYAAAQGFSRRSDLLIVELAGASVAGQPGGPVTGVLSVSSANQSEGFAFTATPGAVPPPGEAMGSSAASAIGPTHLAALLGLALVGGLLLNVMPCVFPILSLKALALAGARQDEHRARRDGFAYTGGVLLACLALGGLMLALRATGEEVGWAFQLQEPLVVAGLLLLAAAITANLAGLFELPVLATGNGSKHGAFGGGLLAAFVATPCTGPFMAAAMGAALVLPTLAALGVFAALGLGLALPFLLLALVPPLRRALPRPGPWMVRFRRVMAVPMGLTALALLWLTWRVAGVGFAAASLVCLVALLAVLALIGREQRHGRAAMRRAGPALAGLLAIAALTLPAAEGQPPMPASNSLGATAFSEDALEDARRQQRPVFVYFTADWCLTCKVNENAAIDREATRRAFAQAEVSVLRGDWTRRDPRLTRFLASHGAAGVPLYLWYQPGDQEPEVLPQVLTSTMLVDLSAQGPSRS